MYLFERKEFFIDISHRVISIMIVLLFYSHYHLLLFNNRSSFWIIEMLKFLKTAEYIYNIKYEEFWMGPVEELLKEISKIQSSYESPATLDP